jgi:hypothetical protein
MRLFNRFFGNLIKILGTVTLLFLLVIVFATLGYKAVNQEAKVATINIVPKQYQQFQAEITWENGSKQVYAINGDEFYIDAKVLKWKDWVSFLGVKTWYEFDRIGGRYTGIEDEKTKPRSLYQLSMQKDLDLYYLRKQYTTLSFLVDAEYGSAAFFLANIPKKIDLFVARSGLMVRIQDIDQSPNLTVE